MQPISTGEAAFRKRLDAWIATKKADKADVGVMLRTTEHERWFAWRAYFASHDCQRELNRMRLAEDGRPYSREPGSLIPWVQVPADWPRQFDASEPEFVVGDYRAVREGRAPLGSHFAEQPLPSPLPTTEERLRAVEGWERGLRRDIAPPHMQPKGEPDEAVQEAAMEKLAEMVRRNEPLPKLSLATMRALVRAGHGNFEVSPEDERRILAEAAAEREAANRDASYPPP
jgi:hypothetical protein